MEKDNDLSTIITADYPSSESKTIFYSFDVRYYDEIITRLYLQGIEKYQYSTPQHQQTSNEPVMRISNDNGKTFGQKRMLSAK
jgi:hypothetical protein